MENPMNTTSSDLQSAGSSNPGPAAPARPAPPFTDVAASTPPSSSEAAASASANELPSALDTTAAATKDVMARVVDGLHAAGDRLADKVTPMVNQVKDASKDAGEISARWTDAARSVIRQKPLAAVTGALLVGAALLQLMTSSKR